MIAAIGAALCLAVPAVFPVDGRVIDAFRAPACARCAGNRGLEVAVAPGAPVSSPVDGTVTFAGPVGGVGWLVVRASSGRVEWVESDAAAFAVLGGVGDLLVSRGDDVRAGEPIGHAALATLFVGFRLGPRRDGLYVDPTPLFSVRPLGRSRPRLVASPESAVSLPRRFDRPVGPPTQRHCSVLPPVVASARGPGP